MPLTVLEKFHAIMEYNRRPSMKTLPAVKGIRKPLLGLSGLQDHDDIIKMTDTVQTSTKTESYY